MTDEKTRALIAEAEKHQELVVCGNPRHTNFDIGCPDCAVVCDYCTCPWPCDARRLADALSTLTVPDGDARERIAKILHPGYGQPGFTAKNCSPCRLAEKDADAILDALPVLSRDIAGEIEAERLDTDPDALGSDAYINGLMRAEEIARSGR